MTGLPIIETKASDISAYIPTNVISITDGQIFLESDLFNQGVRPAINVGTSVSRVGGSAQVKAMRSVAGRLRLDLAQYRELEAFAAFASDLDKTSRAQLEKGSRLVELLKQPQFSPYPVEEEVVSIWIGTTGQIDDIPVEEVRRFEGEFLQYLRSSRKEVLAGIAESKVLSDDAIVTLTEAVKQFKQQFLAKADEVRVNDAPAQPLEGEQGRETVTRQVGRRTRHGGSSSGAAPQDPHGQVDQEDHQGSGARRDEPHRQGAGAGGCLPPLRRGDHRSAHRAGDQRQHRPPAAGSPAAGAPGGCPAHHQRPRTGRRLQRQRHPHLRAAHRQTAR
jgi:hypothetical protein